jgi:hypothetical protein
MASFTESHKLADLSNGWVGAVAIDSADFPYRSLCARVALNLRPCSALATEYRTATARASGRR